MAQFQHPHFTVLVLKTSYAYTQLVQQKECSCSKLFNCENSDYSARFDIANVQLPDRNLKRLLKKRSTQKLKNYWKVLQYLKE